MSAFGERMVERFIQKPGVMNSCSLVGLKFRLLSKASVITANSRLGDHFMRYGLSNTGGSFGGLDQPVVRGVFASSETSSSNGVDLPSTNVTSASNVTNVINHNSVTKTYVVTPNIEGTKANAPASDAGQRDALDVRSTVQIHDNHRGGGSLATLLTARSEKKYDANGDKKSIYEKVLELVKTPFGNSNDGVFRSSQTYGVKEKSKADDGSSNFIQVNTENRYNNFVSNKFRTILSYGYKNNKNSLTKKNFNYGHALPLKKERNVERLTTEQVLENLSGSFVEDDGLADSGKNAKKSSTKSNLPNMVVTSESRSKTVKKLGVKDNYPVLVRKIVSSIGGGIIFNRFYRANKVGDAGAMITKRKDVPGEGSTLARDLSGKVSSDNSIDSRMNRAVVINHIDRRSPVFENFIFKSNVELSFQSSARSKSSAKYPLAESGRGGVLSYKKGAAISERENYEGSNSMLKSEVSQDLVYVKEKHRFSDVGSTKKPHGSNQFHFQPVGEENDGNKFDKLNTSENHVMTRNVGRDSIGLHGVDLSEEIIDQLFDKFVRKMTVESERLEFGR